MSNAKNMGSLSSDLKTMKTILIVFTFINLTCLSFYLFDNDNTVNVLIWKIATVIFYVVFIAMMWIKMPMDRFDKISETLLICIFGIFAMWVWIQFNDLEEKQLQ